MTPRLIVRVDRLWDGDRLWQHAAVVIEGGSIAAVEVGRVELSPGPSPDTEVVDLAGVTLIPGLVDAHQHLCFDPFGDRIARIDRDDDETLFDCVRRAGETALRAGITTVRDLGDRRYLVLRLRELSEAKPELGPTVVASGPPITPTRGHCWFLGGEADGPLEVRAAVADRATHGVDVVKIMATGGLMTPGSGLHKPQYQAGTLAIATRAAHAHGLPITAHAHGPQGIADAVEAGVDGIEHATFLTEDSVAFDPATVERIARAEIIVGATEAAHPTDQLPELVASRHDEYCRNLSSMLSAGVRMVISSDAGIRATKAHDVLPHGALQFWSLGWSTRDALRAMTVVAAQACGLGGRKGRIAPGYDADLLAVAGNPLEDPGALLDVSAVFHRGRRVV